MSAELRGSGSTVAMLSQPVTHLQIISAAGAFFPRDEEQTLLGLLGSVVNRPLIVPVPCF